MAKMTVVEAEAFRRSKNITVDGVRLPNPIRKFTESSLPKHMLQIFKKEGFTQPSPIQCQGTPRRRWPEPTAELALKPPSVRGRRLHFPRQ